MFTALTITKITENCRYLYNYYLINQPIYVCVLDRLFFLQLDNRPKQQSVLRYRTANVEILSYSEASDAPLLQQDFTTDTPANCTGLPMHVDLTQKGSR